MLSYKSTIFQRWNNVDITSGIDVMESTMNGHYTDVCLLMLNQRLQNNVKITLASRCRRINVFSSQFQSSLSARKLITSGKGGHGNVSNIRKTYSEEQHLVNSRYELLTTRQQFCGDISFCGLWFDNDFEIEPKYHHKTVVWLLIAHILSLQDVVLRSMFFLYFIKLSAGKGFLKRIDFIRKPFQIPCIVSSP